MALYLATNVVSYKNLELLPTDYSIVAAFLVRYRRAAGTGTDWYPVEPIASFRGRGR